MSPKKYLLLTCLSFPLLASEMEAVLEVGRDNSGLSAASQERIDATDTATDKIVNEWKVVSKQVEGLKLIQRTKKNSNSSPT
jgi:tellurite resistance protein